MLHKNIRAEETRKRQIKTNALHYLTTRAAKRAKETGEPFSPPTKEEIKVECKRRWDMSLERQMPKEDISGYFD